MAKPSSQRAAPCTLAMLPSDQSTNPLSACSLLQYCSTLTPAEAAALSISPNTSKLVLLRRRMEASKTNTNDSIAPSQAASAKGSGRLSSTPPTASNATAAPRHAPALTPSM